MSAVIKKEKSNIQALRTQVPPKFAIPLKCNQPWLNQSSTAKETFLVTPYIHQNGDPHVKQSLYTASRLCMFVMGFRLKR